MLAFRVDPFWVLALLACAPQSQNAGSLIYLYIQKAYIHHPKGFWSFKIWCCIYIYIYTYTYIVFISRLDSCRAGFGALGLCTTKQE